jgi:glycosyltransferase involved in cell wall biosynthesis
VISISEAPPDLDWAVATGWQTVQALERLPARHKAYFVQSDESRFTEDPETRDEILATYLHRYQYLTEARWIQRWLKNLFGHDAWYVPNVIDPDIVHPAEPITPRGDRLRVLLEGPIDIPFKGMADAFAAVAPLDCEVWCVSSLGRPRPSWRCDRFFERVPMDNMKYIYSSCDVLLKMSQVEGFFGPPLEMMACGGMAVVAKVTGYDEYIVDEHNALVVNPGDVEGARAAIQRLIDDPNLRERLIANGRTTAEAWRWQPTIERLSAAWRGQLA